MMMKFIVYMIFVYIAAKIIGQLIRSVRILLTPNRNIRSTVHRTQTPRSRREVEDIPYEEIKEK